MHLPVAGNCILLKSSVFFYSYMNFPHTLAWRIPQEPHWLLPVHEHIASWRKTSPASPGCSQRRTVHFPWEQRWISPAKSLPPSPRCDPSILQLLRHFLRVFLRTHLQELSTTEKSLPQFLFSRSQMLPLSSQGHGQRFRQKMKKHGALQPEQILCGKGEFPEQWKCLNA